MALQSGTTLLHYRLTEKIGEGGMGVVWRARDTSLERDVAIKVLPASFAVDPERMARFEREARVLASLHHPNIAVVHGLHSADDPSSGATLRFIAMEYVGGEDLGERLARGPIPVDEALEVAGKVARGMCAAHDSGTIHRDLKPANVRITPAGEVKVLDFGLARAAESPAGADASISPTITSAGAVTGTAAGVLLGTAAYMSPEQARGRAVDRRADVWAFGCLLYELLTGQRAFPGDTISDILAEVIKSEPDWSRLPADTPAAVRRLLRRCLAKDPNDRLRDLGDAALDLVERDEPASAGSAVDAETPPGKRGFPKSIAIAGIVAALIVGLAVGTVLQREASGDPAAGAQGRPPVTAGVVELPASEKIAYGAAPIGYDSPMLTISADGRYVVYVGRGGPDGPGGKGSRLYRHDLATFAPPEPIPGTEGALHAFFSPRELSVGFVTNDKLARVDLNGDRLQVLGDVKSATRAVWGDDGNIYVGDSQGRMLHRVPENGGEPELLGDLGYHGLSEILPGGTAALHHFNPHVMRMEFGVVKLYDFERRESRVILENAYDARVLGDRIYFIRGTSLLSAPFDVERGEVTGEPEILVRDVATDSIFGQAQYALSRAGNLVYLPGGDRALGTIAWVDRDGARGTLPVEPRVYGTLDVDPTDRRIAVNVGDVTDYILIYDLDRQEGRKLPTTTSAAWPVWNSAGDSITYTIAEQPFRLVLQKVDSREAPRVLFESTDRRAVASSWSPDDTLVTMNVGDTRILTIDGETVGEIHGFMAEFSPDGRWISYGSEQAGVYETIVQSWPFDEDRVYSVQTEGGIEGTWSQNGELFYRVGDRFYVMETNALDRSASSFTWTPPKLAFEIAFLDTPGQSYDVTSDGQRLYTIVQAEPDVEDRIHVVSGLIMQHTKSVQTSTN